jgi:hypothetical protein
MASAQPTSIRLPPSLKKKLIRWAADDSRPLSVQIIWILEKCCEQRETQEKKR